MNGNITASLYFVPHLLLVLLVHTMSGVLLLAARLPTLYCQHASIPESALCLLVQSAPPRL